METHIHIYDSSQRVAERFAQWLHTWIEAQPEGPLHWALSGGSTPERLFQHLAAHYADRLPWERLHLWWGDERCVPPDHEESNYGMTQTHLLSRVNLPEANIHRVRGEAEVYQAEAERYAEEVRTHVPGVDGMPRFDLIMLGMGDDGHTASIFPSQLHLLEDKALTALATHPDTQQPRVTFTGPLLNHAATVAFLVTGPRKAGRTAQILGGRPGARHLPAYHVRPTDGVLHWYLDRAAAADLQG